jgi:hypothetical protein
MGAVKAEKNGLYDRDFYSWALEQSDALREHRTEDLDWENLAEEVGDLARSERRAFRSQCATLVEHLLKIALAPQLVLESNRRVWTVAVREARRRIGRLLKESPGLKSSIGELFEEAWADGRDEALKSLDCEDGSIPEAPLWSFDQATDEKFVPRDDIA